MKQIEIDYTGLFPVVCVVFNPHGFKSRIRLYHEFKKYMLSCGVKLMTVEIAFKKRPFDVTNDSDEWNIQLRSNHVIWHKEKALNIGIKKLYKVIPNFEKFAWVDADVLFLNPNWVKDAVNALDHYQVIQLFSQVGHLTQHHEIQWTCKGVFYDWVHKKGFHQFPDIPLKYLSGGHPGLAWAMRRDTYENLGGLLDFTVSGSGDLMMCNALRGNVLMSTKPGITAGFKSALQSWQAKCDKHVKGNVGYINGCVVDYFHGKSENRGYEKRWDIMNFHQYDPATDIVTGENGLWEYAGNKPKLEQDLRYSTMLRNEDATE